jgi:hypothetical protein
MGPVILFILFVITIPVDIDLFRFYLRPNTIDMMMWAVFLYMGLRYGLLQWKENNPMLFMLMMFFYGVVVIIRFGTYNHIQHELIHRCLDAGIDISDIIKIGF